MPDSRVRPLQSRPYGGRRAAVCTDVYRKKARLYQKCRTAQSQRDRWRVQIAPKASEGKKGRPAMIGGGGGGGEAPGWAVGGGARAGGGGQPPGGGRGRRQPRVHRRLPLAVQQQGGLRGAVRPLDVEGDAFPGPVRRQGKGQDVHPFGVLAAQMEPRRAGEEVGAARKLPGCDFDVHHVWIVPFPGRCGAPF